MEKLEIAKELLENSLNVYIKIKIEEYIFRFEGLESGVYCNKQNFEDDSMIRFHNCITYIHETGFNIKGWMLYEIPIYYSHCFYNESIGKRFDLMVLNIGEVMPAYLDYSEEKAAETIEEAIEKYIY
ncbi:hypothetical protein P9W99_04975 [Bacillus cereus]|uniref:Uncharacterized protein n=3 Tax=Bacillus cereus group TaxID=86661 RepID=A0A9W5QCM5_BACCE|nr:MULTISPECIES: hypothetical protein [Bacillus]AIE37083.1 hypothetical protein BTK_33791 [Bacillus thuringiensis serovar kurstaki str. HD-1]AJK38520.1 hypothetical protein BG08_6843 [Bacillus thuringiensis serovar kurstaki]AKJ62996.1 hypothetical protein XI92_33190 [Bacillus thuringiensis]ALL62401.1 hypothetical protein AQ980_31695 [Bacillus thuringiensis]AMX80597.1 hypothetical protein BtBc_29800 [Bacillus thuringiensis]